MIGHLSTSIDYHNFTPYHILIQIAQQLKALAAQLPAQPVSHVDQAIWKCLVGMMRKEVAPGQSRKQILATLDSMQH